MLIKTFYTIQYYCAYYYTTRANAIDKHIIYFVFHFHFIFYTIIASLGVWNSYYVYTVYYIYKYIYTYI